MRHRANTKKKQRRLEARNEDLQNQWAVDPWSASACSAVLVIGRLEPLSIEHVHRGNRSSEEDAMRRGVRHNRTSHGTPNSDRIDIQQTFSPRKAHSDRSTELAHSPEFSECV